MSERGVPIGGFRSLDRKPVGSTESKEKLASVAVAVLIVGLDPSRNGDNERDPLIWTITELKSKPGTNKTAGQISLPAETRKNGEELEDNVLGALGEFCDDALFSKYIRNHLVKVDGKWLREGGVFVGDKSTDVVVLIYDGALDIPLSPACPDEVTPNGWVRKSELTKDQRLRDVFRQILELDTQEDLVKKSLEAYHNSPEKRLKIIPESLNSIQAFCNDREYGIDVKVMDSFYLEFAERFPEARERIFQSIKFLVDSQKSKERNFMEEEKNVVELGESIRSLSLGEFKIGIGKVTGSDISLSDYVPDTHVSEVVVRDWFIMKRKIQISGGEFRWRSLPDKSVNAWGGWKLERGDRLEPKLGMEWYLSFNGRPPGDKSGSHKYVIPVSKIEDLRLRPHDTGF